MSWMFKAAIEGRLDDAMEVEAEIGARAVTGAVRLAGSYTQNAYRRQVESAFGSFEGRGGVIKAWQRKDYPANGHYSLKASSMVFSKATRIVAAFSQARTVRPSTQGGLLVPTQWAISQGLDKISDKGEGKTRHRYMDRAALEQKLGPLFEVRSPSGVLMLCYKDGLGKVRALAYIRYSVRLRKLFDLQGPPAKFRAQLPQYIVNAWNRAERPRKRSGVSVQIDG